MSHDAWNRFGDDGYKHYLVVEAGFKYNMMDIQAAIGLHQLTHIDEWQTRRQQVWAMYNEAFKDLPVTLPAPTPDYMEHAHHLYTILIDEEKTGISRDDFLMAMTAENIGVGVHYLSVPEHPYYQERFGWSPEDCPHATRVGRQTVSLPLSARLTDADVQDVIDAVHKVLNK